VSKHVSPQRVCGENRNGYGLNVCPSTRRVCVDDSYSKIKPLKQVEMKIHDSSKPVIKGYLHLDLKKGKDKYNILGVKRVHEELPSEPNRSKKVRVVDSKVATGKQGAAQLVTIKKIEDLL